MHEHTYPLLLNTHRHILFERTQVQHPDPCRLYIQETHQLLHLSHVTGSPIQLLALPPPTPIFQSHHILCHVSHTHQYGDVAGAHSISYQISQPLTDKPSVYRQNINSNSNNYYKTEMNLIGVILVMSIISWQLWQNTLIYTPSSPRRSSGEMGLLEEGVVYNYKWNARLIIIAISMLHSTLCTTVRFTAKCELSQNTLSILHCRRIDSQQKGSD